jgi:two-component sensor histidine kinase
MDKNKSVRDVSVLSLAELDWPKEALDEICHLLQSASNINYTRYQQTLRQRIVQRMATCKIERLSDYLRYIKEHPAEVDVLRQKEAISYGKKWLPVQSEVVDNGRYASEHADRRLPLKEPELETVGPDEVIYGAGEPAIENDQLINALREELSTTKKDVSSIIQEQEATNQILRVLNEEVRAANEELSLVNRELQDQNAALNRTNDDLNNLLSSINLPIVMLDNNLRIRRLTPAARHMMNLSFDDLGSVRDLPLQVQTPHLESLVLDVIRLAVIKEQEVQDREGRWYNMRIQPYRTGEGKVDGAVITLIYTDELKRSLEQLKKSYEKEVLLKEIHHRVKNNLQIISSLLSLQSGYIKDVQAREAIRESHNRVRSMALIHELLYQSKDLAQIDMGEYLQKLAKNLLYSYAIDQQAIALKIQVEKMSLSIDTAITSGLIVNELVSNSLKHAFAAGQTGKIGIALSESDDYQTTLRVWDNGIGFPKDLDFRNTKSLGLQLVTALTNQLRGAIELDDHNGTEFKITFTELRSIGKAEKQTYGYQIKK